MRMRILTAVAVLVSAYVHLKLWLDGFRDLDKIGPAFMTNAVAGVVIAILLFALSWPISRLLRGDAEAPRQVGSPDDEAVQEQVSEEHPHVHGPGCGHLAVEHAGHIDYVHEGHRHAPHQDHYDEH